MVKIFKEIVSLIAFLAIITGLGTLIYGVEFQQGLGVLAGYDDAVMNSQLRHLGAIWCGYGFLLLYCLKNLPERHRLLAYALAFIVLGGIGRLITLWQFGLPEITVSRIFMGVSLTVSLIGVPLLLFWLSRLTPEMSPSKDED